MFQSCDNAAEANKRSGGAEYLQSEVKGGAKGGKREGDADGGKELGGLFASVGEELVEGGLETVGVPSALFEAVGGSLE